MGGAASVPVPTSDEDCGAFERLVAFAGAVAVARLLRCASLKAWGERPSLLRIVAASRAREDEARWASLRRGEDSVVPFQSTLEELFRGRWRRFSITRDVLLCGAPCAGCASAGHVLSTAGGKRTWARCSACAGAGHAYRLAKETVALDVRLPPGAADASAYRFPRVGDEAPGRAPGDVVFTVATRRHDTYERIGAHVMTCRTGRRGALEPFKLRCLDGTFRRFEPPRGASNAPDDAPLVLVARGHGFPRPAGGPRGHLYVRVHLRAAPASTADRLRVAVADALTDDAAVVPLCVADAAELKQLSHPKPESPARRAPPVKVTARAERRRTPSPPTVGGNEEADLLRMLAAFPLS